MRRTAVAVLCVFGLIGYSLHGWALSSPVLRVTGAVGQPLSLSLGDMDKFQPVTVRLNEILQGGGFRGVFDYRGVPLRSLLELAAIGKKEASFRKPVDLAVVVRSKSGEKTVLSWGEVFYRNPAEVIIAFSGSPVMPAKSCEGCHKPEVYQPRLGQLTRAVGFPKLVVANDFYTDRCLEDIVGIEVIDPSAGMAAQKVPVLYSPSFTVTGAVGHPLEISELSSYDHVQLPAKQVGEGKGFHGLRQFRGVPLMRILESANVAADLRTLILISAPDGYRSLLSYGEVSLSPQGRDFIIADGMPDQPIKEKGAFILVCPSDLAADRWVKAVAKIEVIRLP